MSLTASCTGRTCVLSAGIPTGYTTTTGAQLLYVWQFGPSMTIGGTNLRQETLIFGAPGTYPITVQARNGTTVVATATQTLTIK